MMTTHMRFTAMATPAVYRRVQSCAALLMLLMTLAACDSPTGIRSKSARIQLNSDHASATTIGETIQIDATGLDASGAPIAATNLVWEMSSEGILESLGDGRFKVLKEGDVRVAIVYRNDPSVRVTATVSVAASFLAKACVRRTDQDPTGVKASCGEERVTVFARGES